MAQRPTCQPLRGSTSLDYTHVRAGTLSGRKFGGGGGSGPPFERDPRLPHLPRARRILRLAPHPTAPTPPAPRALPPSLPARHAGLVSLAAPFLLKPQAASAPPVAVSLWFGFLAMRI